MIEQLKNLQKKKRLDSGFKPQIGFQYHYDICDGCWYSLNDEHPPGDRSSCQENYALWKLTNLFYGREEDDSAYSVRKYTLGHHYRNCNAFACDICRGFYNLLLRGPYDIPFDFWTLPSMRRIFVGEILSMDITKLSMSDIITLSEGASHVVYMTDPSTP